MSTINRDEWLSALKDAGLEQVDDQRALTASEFASMMGLKLTTARHRLIALVGTGKATVTTKRAADSRGHIVFCTAYRLTPQRKGKS